MILFPHDFYNNDKNTIINIKNKYKRRIDRLMQILNNINNELIFVYSDLLLNEFQKSKFNQCNIYIENKYMNCHKETILDNISSMFMNCKIIHIDNIENYNL